MDLQIDQYLNLAALYLDSLPGLTADDLAAKIDRDMAAEASVTLMTADGSQNVNKMTFFFIYLTYSIMAVMILGVTSIMLVFNKSDLRRRNLSSPVNPLRFNLQLVLGNLIFALAIWLLMSLLSLLLGSQPVNIKQFMILSLNALIFTMTALSFSFLVSQFIGSRAAQQSIANVFSLGACFVSGVFVPQDMLGKTVHTIASFTPTYWYVRAVNEIGGLSSFTLQTLQTAGTYMLIEIGFALALLAVSLAVIKQKRQAQA
jgi:ABC-2 type transport system permease protein